MPSLQERLDEFKRAFESGAPPYNAPREAVETMHRASVPDGQKFLVVVDEAAVQSAPPLTLLQNWTATLRKLKMACN